MAKYRIKPLIWKESETESAKKLYESEPGIGMLFQIWVYNDKVALVHKETTMYPKTVEIAKQLAQGIWETYLKTFFELEKEEYRV